MADDPSSDQIDFADEMQHLVNQANAPAPSRSAEARATPMAKVDKTELLLALGEMVRPLAIDLEGLKRAGSDQNVLLTALGKTFNAHRSIPQSLESIVQQMQRLNSVESANQKLFDALHAELKGYKDNFLFDALQKPFIRELVTLFDDLSSIHAQTDERLRAVRGGGGGAEQAFLEPLVGNLENQVHHLLEIFMRMDVNIVQTPVGAPMDKRVHRPVSVVPAASADEEGLVVRSVRPGFFWRERPVRAEDVVVSRWTPPAGEAPLAGNGD